MGAITKYPKGLLSLLGAQVQGRTPDDLASQVALTLDGTDLWLLNERISFLLSENNPGGVGMNLATAGSSFQVPAGEIWYVWNYSVGVTLAAATAIEFAAACQFQQLGQKLGEYANANVVGENFFSDARGPFWAEPGARFGYIVKRVTGVNSMAMIATVTKLRI